MKTQVPLKFVRHAQKALTSPSATFDLTFTDGLRGEGDYINYAFLH